MKINSQWLDGRCFIATNANGHSVVMDGTPSDENYTKRGASPMELLLMGAAGCSGIDVVDILKKQRQNVASCHTTVSAERANEVPKVFTKIHLHFVLQGKDLQENAVAKAVALSAEKYCSASIMLGKTAQVSHSFEIQNEN